MTEQNTPEIAFTLSAEAANHLYQLSEGNGGSSISLPSLPGIQDPRISSNARDADSGRIPSKLILTETATGKTFATDYFEPADNNWWTDEPFNSPASFYPVVKKERMIVEEYWEASTVSV